MDELCQPAQETPKKRVVLLGFDGMPHELLNPLIQSNKLSHFKKLVEGGIYGVLNSTIVPSSSVAWTSMMTGQSPGKTGIFSFFLPQPDYNVRLITSHLRRQKALWEILSELGKKVLVINEPISAPPDEVNGIMVAGLLSEQGKPFTFPPLLSPQLTSLGYQTSYRKLKLEKQMFESPFGKDLLQYNLLGMSQLERNKEQLALTFMDSCDWDLLIAVFTMPDRLQHNRQDIGDDPLVSTYQLMDSFLGDFLDRLKPDDLLIVASDHGFKWFPKIFFLSKWLNDHHLLSSHDGRIDWKNTKIYPMDTVGNYATLRVNLRGREEKGIVAEEDYRGLVESVKKQMVLEKDLSTSDQVIKTCWSREELYGEIVTPGEPDLIMECQKDYKVVRDLHFPSETVIKLQQPIYDHRKEGVVFFYGESVSTGGLSPTLEIIDIATTILAYLQGWVPQEMEGQAFAEALSLTPGKTVNRHPFDLSRNKWDQRDASGQRNPELMEKLKSLGYMK